jgi:hypothetical protein
MKLQGKNILFLDSQEVNEALFCVEMLKKTSQSRIEKREKTLYSLRIGFVKANNIVKV